MSLNPSQVIAAALRMNGTLAGGDEPSSDEMTDGMDSLNRMKRAMFGTVIGPRLSPQNCECIVAIQAENGGEYEMPEAAFTLTAPWNPRSGARFGVVDCKLDFNVYPVTILNNFRLLEGVNGPLTLTAVGDNRRWWFRGDQGNWIREADWTSPQAVIEFPDVLIAYLPYMLAVAVANEYGQDLRADTVQLANEGRQAFARSYQRRGRNSLDPPVGVLIANSAPAAPQQAQG